MLAFLLSLSQSPDWPSPAWIFGQHISSDRTLSGEELLSEYRFNSGTAKHYFCSNCGIYTFHQRRSNPREYGVNVACLEGISPFDFAEVPVLDGAHHPSDGGGVRLAGTLRFIPAE